MYTNNKTESKLLYECLLIVAIGLIGMTIFVFVFDAYGFFWDQKPPKPTIVTQNPLIVAKFDALYDKYPDITQSDVDEAHRAASYECYSAAKENVERDDPESADSPLGQLIGLSFCQGFMGGEMEDYLDQLGISYTENPDNREAPILIGNQ